MTRNVKRAALLLSVAALATAASAELRISDVCASCQPDVPACKDLGWVELVNDGDEPVNLKDYKLVTTNRGKKLKTGDKDISPLLDREVAPGAATRVYTGEMFANGDDGTTVAEYDYGVYGRIMVVPKKINQKKYPMVQLLKGKKTLQTVFVPVDLADGLVYHAATRTLGDDPRPYGPNIGCLYGVKDAEDPWKAFPQAEIGVDYDVRFPVNPIDLSAADADRIASVRLIYRVALGEAVTNAAPMTAVETNAADGVVYAGTIPGAAFSAAGQLVQFAALITDGAGREFRSPSFRNPDDGCEWYGTIVEPDGLDSATLQTFHLFADAASLSQMNTDESKQDRSVVPYCARVGVYDSESGLYFDNVRIDLRGNTSGAFHKKSHGLRFNKCQPLVFSNDFTRAEIECRKSSLVAEFVDPSLVRQSLSFKVFRDMGLPTPFHYPVRVNLNGEFYQLAFHSERFTDELIEDHYGFDPLGYGYKNAGDLQYLNTHAGSIEKKTPDDGSENDLSVLATLSDALKGSDATATAVRLLDLPAWINYLAAARITHETDDANANLSVYFDANGTGTWMPLCYDLQLSWGQSWTGNENKRGTVADDDSGKSHPFYDGGNLAFKAVWSSEKFRRLYLRRLRTLMDDVLKEPGTPRCETPFWEYVSAVTNAARAEATLDQAKWKPQTYAINQPMHSWKTWMSVETALDDLWSNYVEKRRTHLFVTHSVTNSAKAIGYGKTLNAGIPLPQAPTAELKDGFSVVPYADGALVKNGALVIRNGNAAAVDMSGWKLSKAVKWTLPPGTVVDADDVIYIVADRKRYVEARGQSLTDEVIVGNAEFNDVARNPVVLEDADGIGVIKAYPPPVVELGGVTATPGTDYAGSRVVVSLGDGFAANGCDVAATLSIDGCADAVDGEVDLKAGTIAFDASGVAALSASSVRSGKVTVAVGGVVNTCAVVFEQGAVTRIPSSGWIRETSADVGATGAWSTGPEIRGSSMYFEDGSSFAPSAAMPDSSVAVMTFRGALGGAPDGDFDPDAHAGVKIVDTVLGDRYAFKTAYGVETNMLVEAERGREVEVEVRLDYRLGQAVYTIDGRAFGPYGTVPGAVRTSEIVFGGCGDIESLTGEHEKRELDANLAKAGDTEYATVADAVEAGGSPVRLLWDASWRPEKHGVWTFDFGGHTLDLGDGPADPPIRFIENSDGTTTVTWRIPRFFMSFR